MKNLIDRAKSYKTFLELRINVFLCASFPPITAGNLVKHVIDYVEPGIKIPQFSSLSTVSKVLFKCEVCEIYSFFLKTNGKVCQAGLGKLEGHRQLYEHGNSDHHVKAVEFLLSQPKEIEKVTTYKYTTMTFLI